MVLSGPRNVPSAQILKCAPRTTTADPLCNGRKLRKINWHKPKNAPDLWSRARFRSIVYQ
jgi:hypothetical protein